MSGSRSCELCGRSLFPGPGARFAHLRRVHPSAHRAVWVRLAAPWAFLGVAGLSLAAGWPPWTPAVVLGVLLVTNVALRRRISVERRAGGGRPLPSARHLLAGGGAGVAALIGLIVVLALMAGRR
jgi:hypothetical protein